jgi:hypothetical protein
MCLDTQAGATAFHQWGWLRLMATALGSHFLPLGFYSGDALVGLAPLLIKQLGPYKNANWVPFPYLGLLAPRALQMEVLQVLDQYQRRNGVGLVQIGFAPHADFNVPLLQAEGYDVRMDTTMVVPLTGHDEQALFARMDPKRRWQIRRAQRAGVMVRPATEQEICSDLNHMLREVFTRQNLPPPYPEGAAALVWEHYHSDHRAHLTTASYQGEPVAISITLADQKRAYSWQVSGYTRFRHLHAPALLYWDAIRWALERGYQAFDLVGNPHPGIADYKLQFGAHELPYPVASRINARSAAWGRDVYGQISRWIHARAAGSSDDGPDANGDDSAVRR